MLELHEKTYRSTILLTEMGDVEIAWDSNEDNAMRELIQKKMDQGVRFFILKPIIGSYLHAKVRLKTMADLKTARISIKDADIEKMWADGKVALHRSPSGELEMQGGAAKTADEVARNRTVGVYIPQGG